MTGIIIQARLGSTRMPQKVLRRMPNGLTMLETVVLKARKSGANGVYLTTPDRELIALFSALFDGCNLHTGPRDVLREYLDTATRYQIDPIIRITADCPLIRPEIIRSAYTLFGVLDCDYLYNVLDGSDVEVFSRKLLARACAEAVAPEDREHVGPWMKRNGKVFKMECPNLDVRSVNTKEDFESVCRLMENDYDSALSGNGNRVE